MKTTLLSTLFLAAPLQAGLLPITEHVDIRWRWDSSNGWACQAVTDSNGELARDPRDVFLALSDKPYSAANPANSGARFIQPSTAAFSFTGVLPGQPLWIAVQGTPGMGEAWPGLENNQPAGTFGSYIPADLRVSQTTARPWIRISLESYTPPHGVNASFSLWTSSGSTPRVWMSTRDISVVNAYHYAEGTHTHLNWGFSALGIHRVGLKASAFSGPGATNPTGYSTAQTLTFAIGPFARWQASHFDNDALDDPEVSGPDADPDRDGMINLVEHAFGLDPHNGSSAPVGNGLGLPEISLVKEGGVFYEVLKFPRRRAGSQISPLIYQPQFSGTPSGDWSGDGISLTVEDFPAGLFGLNVEWELVTCRRNVGTAPPARSFARVVVALGGAG